MKLTFCGAAGTVTGSAHLIELDNGFRFLLDCGLYQGNEKDMKNFNEEWLFDPAKLDAVVLSHAHIDHSGRLPKLYKDGFRGTIHATHATRSLCTIMLLDAAKIQERDAEYFNKHELLRKPASQRQEQEPLYSSEDVKGTMDLFTTYGYEKWFQIYPDVDVLFRDAGHILGSASVTLRIRENGKTIHVGFTGDIGRPNRPILRDPQAMDPLEYLICESTYGDRDHLGKPDEEDKFLEIIRHTCIEKKGKLIIPAFSVGRTQEIVYILDQLENAGKLPEIPVYVDSPLSVNATTIYGSHPECFDRELTQYLLTDPNPFGFNKLRYITQTEDSKKLNTATEPSIIISSSGMANAGRIKHHLYNNLENPRNTILIVGYCSPDTPGGMLRNGAQAVRLFGDWKQVNAEVELMDSFSAHADRNELIDFLSNQFGSLRKLFLVHGEPEPQKAFQLLLEQNGFTHTHIPVLGESIRIEA